MNLILDLTAPMFLILFCAGCAIGWLLWARKHWRIQYWIIPLFIFQILVLIKLTVFPIFIFDSETLARIREDAGKYFVLYQAVPFASIANYFRSGAMLQLLGNLLLLAPMAVFVEIFLRQRPRAWKVALGVSALSFGIELLQLAINLLTGHPSRVADVDDLILNIAGIALAIAFSRCISKVQRIRPFLRKVFYRA